MPDYTKNLLIKITGDTKTAQTALAELDNSLAKSAKTTTDLGAKIVADWKAFEEQAAKSAASIDKIGAGGPSLTAQLSDQLNQKFAATHPLASGLLDTAGVSASSAAVVAGTAVAGAALVKFGKDAVDSYARATEAVDKFQDVSNATAKDSSIFVGASRQLGVSSDELSTAIGKMLKTVNANEAAFKSYGVEIQRTSGGAVDSIGTFQNIAQAFANIPDPAKRAELASMAFGRGWQSIVDVLERGGPQLNEAFKSAAAHQPIFSQKELEDAKDFSIKMQEIKGDVEKVKVAIGGTIVGNLSGDLETLKAIADKIHEIRDLVPGAGNAFEDIGHSMTKMLPGVGVVVSAYDAVSAAKDALRGASSEAGNFSASWTNARNAAFDLSAGLGTTTYNAISSASALRTLSDYLKAGAADWQAYTGTVRTVQATTDGYQAALDDLSSVQDKFSTGVSKSGSSMADAARQIADAEENLAQVTADAQQRIVDVNESSAQRIVDAQQRVQDAQQAAADAAESSAQRVDDAKQRLADAVNASLRDANPYDAQRRVDDARQQLLRTEAEAAKQSEKSAKDVAKAQDNLADTQKQAAKDRAKAEEEASRQIESATKAVQRAQESAAKATEAAGKAAEITGGQLRDAADKAQTLVDKTFDLGYQTLIMGGSMNDVQPKIDAAKAKIKELGDAGLISAGQVAGLKQKLDEIPHEISTSYTLHLDLESFKRELQAASQQFQDPQTRANVAAGIWDALPGADIIPQFKRDAGGPLPPGLSMVFNGTGRDEWVSTPEQLRAIANKGGGGVTNHFYINGSVFTESDLADFITRAVQRGTAGIRS